MNYILMILFLSQFSVSALMNTILLLLYCILVFLFMVYFNIEWYSLIFILIYLGGILVVFLYNLSLNSNPMTPDITMWRIFFFFWFFFIIYFIPICIPFQSVIININTELFNTNSEKFIVFMCLYMLFVLFVVAKITSVEKSAVRKSRFL
uniref:ND6 protein n=1 Tax=Phagocata gracilis TaxID=1354672 RepID=A0A0C4ZKL6_9PLAT